MAKKKKDPRGRKARGGEPSGNVTVRMTDAERASYQDAAELAGMSLADWIRAACQERLAREKR